MTDRNIPGPVPPMDALPPTAADSWRMVAEKWKAWRGTTDYQANKDTGQIRSFKRDPAGALMKLRPDGDGYLRFNYTDDAGVRHHNFSVARAVLLAHDPDGYRPGLHACHGPGGRQDNRLANLRWDTPDANREEALAVRLENTPPKPRPPKLCIVCGGPFGTPGRRCGACRERIARNAAVMLARGAELQETADAVGYPPVPLLKLACELGGLRLTVTQRHRQPLTRRLRSVMHGRQASRQNSDGA